MPTTSPGTAPPSSKSRSIDGKSVVEAAQAAREQAVAVVALRHRAAILDGRRQGVTVEDRDTIEVSAQHPRGQKPADAGADDDGVVAVETSGRGAWRELLVHCRLLLVGQVAVA